MSEIAATVRQPALFIPHGGGPCFFMPDPHGTWRGMEAYLKNIAGSLPAKPRAILVVSGHWEGPAFTFTGKDEHPGLMFDYYGFPPETYKLTWPARGAPWRAERGRELIEAAGLPAAIDPERGFDHGVFVPLKVAFPEADIPVVQMSLHASLDPAVHLAMYEFPDRASLDAANDGEEIKRLVKDFDRDWPDVKRTREILVLAEEWQAQ